MYSTDSVANNKGITAAGKVVLNSSVERFLRHRLDTSCSQLLQAEHTTEKQRQHNLRLRPHKMIVRVFQPAAWSFVSKTTSKYNTTLLAMMIKKRRHLLCLTAAAALSTSAQAWVSTLPAHRHQHRAVVASQESFSTMSINKIQSSLPLQIKNSIPAPPSSSRLYYSSKGSSDNDGDIVSSIGNAAKSILPKSWFQSKEEKEAKLRQKQMKDDMAGSINEMFKDAPLGIRMMGKMVAPLISSVASTVAEGLAEQQKTTAQVLEDATRYMVNDPDVLSALGGEPIRVGAPFSQSSSTTSINGQTQTRIELGVPVSGRSGDGMAQISSTQDGISRIQVQAMGRVLNVDLTKSAGGGSSTTKKTAGRFNGNSGDDNIIEAEIIEKKDVN